MSDVRELDKRSIAHAFDRAARSYDAHDVLQREVAARLLERLDFTTVAPRHVLDLGAGTGRCARALAARYRKAMITQCDLAPAMLRISRAQERRWFSRQRFVCADAERLPFAGGMFELIVSSLSLQWCEDLPAVFAGARHCLAEGGLFLFSTLGPDTLHELRTASAAVDGEARVNRFIDMHIIGDALGTAGFADPVMEAEHITVEYDDVMTLLRDLKGIGATNAQSARPRGMLARTRLAALVAAYEPFRRAGRLPATYEVVYGHAWAAAPRPAKGPTGQVFPLRELRRR
ncbi:MAG: malonyl-ACP O-methyltransferase BioC [Gammaproteobacteria bacterium]